MTVWFAPTPPAGQKRQLDPDLAEERLVEIFRLYGPLKPGSTRRWRPGDLESVN